MRDIALAHGAGAVTDAAAAPSRPRRRRAGPSRWCCGRSWPCPPAALARAMAGDAGEAAQAVRVLAVMSLAGGRIDPDKIALVQEYADAVGVHESYVAVLAKEAAGEIAAASACMIRKNAESFPRLDLTGIDTDPIAPFLPYRDGRDDPALAARYETLGELAPGTFGRAFFEHFKRNGFAFPVTPTAWPRAHHPPRHVPRAEQLHHLATRRAAGIHVHRRHAPRPPHVRRGTPALFSWHLGIVLKQGRRQLARRVRAPHVLDRMGPRRGDQHRRARPRLGLLGGDGMAAAGTPGRNTAYPRRPNLGGLSPARTRRTGVTTYRAVGLPGTPPGLLPKGHGRLGHTNPHATSFVRIR